jgi:hypothetical protein
MEIVSSAAASANSASAAHTQASFMAAEEEEERRSGAARRRDQGCRSEVRKSLQSARASGLGPRCTRPRQNQRYMPRQRRAECSAAHISAQSAARDAEETAAGAARVRHRVAPHTAARVPARGRSSAAASRRRRAVTQRNRSLGERCAACTQHHRASVRIRPPCSCPPSRTRSAQHASASARRHAEHACWCFTQMPRKAGMLKQGARARRGRALSTLTSPSTSWYTYATSCGSETET